MGYFPEFLCTGGRDVHFKEVDQMKTMPFALALLGLVVGGASATPDWLAGCAFITHNVPELQYTENPGTLCQDYSTYAISSAEEQINSIYTGGFAAIANWFILVAFVEDDKEWCSAQFGFDEFEMGHDGIFTFSFWGPCFPPTGGFEIPSACWPQPLEGTALVVTGDPWTGNYVPLYYFGGYAYGYGDPGIMQLIPDPTVVNPFGGLGNCLPVPGMYDAMLGGMGVDMPGTYVEPVYVPQPGVCCFGEDCVNMFTQWDCEDQGGVWMAGPPDCGPPNPCLILGACCVGGNCVITTQSVCEQGGGEWLGEGTVCEPNPCPAVCCEGCACHIMLEQECLQSGWDWYPDWTTCTPNPCPTPAGSTSWGTIKALYR